MMHLGQANFTVIKVGQTPILILQCLKDAKSSRHCMLQCLHPAGPPSITCPSIEAVFSYDVFYYKLKIHRLLQQHDLAIHLRL